MKDLTEGSEEGSVWDAGGGHRYHLEKVVGNGAFGIVWRARSEEGEVVAIKKVMLDRRYHNRELQMMKVMEHENVIKLKHYFEKAGRKKDETFLHLVMDYLPETIRSVALKYHKRAKRFQIDHIKAYLWQTFKALEYIHARRICHRDIKPDNLLCDPTTLKCRLCDFGCSKVLVKGQPNVSYICSRYYRAPELMFGATEYAVSVDVWSVGTILMELLLGHLPFQGQDSTQQHLVEIMKLLGTPTDRDLQAMRAACTAEELPKLKAYPWERIFPANTPQEAIDLAQRLLRYDPDERLTAGQALAHPFFDGIDSLVEGSSSGASALAPSTYETPTAVRPSMSAADWERRVGTQFDELRAGLPGGAFAEALTRHADSVLQGGATGEGGAQQLAAAVRQAFATSMRERDEAARSLQQKVVDVARRHQLPCEAATAAAGNGGNGNGSGAASSSAASSTEVAQLKAQLEEIKAAQRSLTEALAEKNELQASIKAAQGRLNGTAPLEAGHSADGMGEKGPPGFGRRAPAQPTRQNTMVVDSPQLPAGKLQADNLGQVTPLGLSSGSEQSPNAAARPGSGGRRSGRSRLADKSEEGAADGAADGATDT